MKKYFITGLVILLPLALTLSIVFFIFDFLTGPFLGIVKAVFDHYHLFEQGFLFLTASQIQSIIAKCLILISLFFFVSALGFIGKLVLFSTVMKVTDYVVRKIPLVNSIYQTCQELIRTLFTSKTHSFKQVVLVPFPHLKTYSLGLITREELSCLAGTPHAAAAAVFIPTAPNPTSGFLVMCDKKELIYLDMKVEEAFKYVLSCGVIAPDFQALVKAHENAQVCDPLIAPGDKDEL